MEPIALLLFALMQATGPELAVEAPPSGTLALGESVEFTVRLSLGNTAPDADVRLRPLELTNLHKTHMESGAHLVQEESSADLIRWYRIRLEPSSAGEAVLGTVAAEIAVPGGEPLVLQAEGFSLQIIEPFDWGATLWLLLWIGLPAVLIAAVAFAVARYRKRARRGAIEEQDEERIRFEKEVDRLSRAGDFRGAADLAYGWILSAIGSGETHDDEAAESFSTRGDLKAALRLGEEVRYAGYRPDRSEAKYLIRIAKGISRADSESGLAAEERGK
jgi:hypothetical protein